MGAVMGGIAVGGWRVFVFFMHSITIGERGSFFFFFVNLKY